MSEVPRVPDGLRWSPDREEFFLELNGLAYEATVEARGNPLGLGLPADAVKLGDVEALHAEVEELTAESWQVARVHSAALRLEANRANAAKDELAKLRTDIRASLRSHEDCEGWCDVAQDIEGILREAE